MPRRLKSGDRYARVKWQFYGFWVLFFVWLAMTFVGIAATLNLPFRSTYVLPLVVKNETVIDDHYVGALYTQKFTFIWATCLVAPVLRTVLAFAALSYLTAHRDKRLNLAIFGVFFILYFVGEGCNLVAHGLEWKDANKFPTDLADTNFDKNIANSWHYCCEYGNYTPYCENNLGVNMSIPCYGWVAGEKELTVNADFMVSIAITIGSLVCAFLMAIMGYSGREELFMALETQDGQTILVSAN